jgi:flagellar basal body rod protein FlgF
LNIRQAFPYPNISRATHCPVEVSILLTSLTAAATNGFREDAEEVHEVQVQAHNLKAKIQAD